MVPGKRAESIMHIVYLVPDAIRPDRDKTGRQKNPRRGTNSMSSNKSYGDDDRTSRNTTSPNLDVHCASTASSPSDDDNLRSFCESTAPNTAAVQQKDLILATLSQIESICAEFLDDPRLSPTSNNGRVVGTLTDLIANTAVIAHRTSVSLTSGHQSWLLARLQRSITSPRSLCMRSCFEANGCSRHRLRKYIEADR